eukprot:TRINITY_DN118620_c0_g1_i1.p1 TRINITY_DN118620_c0_g1~~TRINITY_DN118620_c0_g1_i1.p1  ORF type:complete len:276 (-),score=29.58 TRINITY_DN118620_c0_g1_i1:174-905(-)
MTVMHRRLVSLVFAFTMPSVVCQYKQIANCVPGDIIRGQEETDGKVVHYTKALQAVLPNIYGDLALLAESDTGTCLTAADLVNTNKVTSETVMTKVPELVGLNYTTADKQAALNKGYLYIFSNKNFKEHKFVAHCVPGGIVGSLPNTKGTIALYSMALRTMLPTMIGKLAYLAKGQADVCITAAEKVNDGLFSPQDLKDGKMKLDAVGMAEGLKKADDKYSYLYVTENKLWDLKTDAWEGFRI